MAHSRSERGLGSSNSCAPVSALEMTKMTKWWIGLLLAAPFWSGCGGILPPLGNEIDVGHDPYGVFVGGSDRGSDLYAFDPSRNAVRPLTYTAVAELAPTLSPDGMQVALLRAAT